MNRAELNILKVSLKTELGMLNKIIRVISSCETEEQLEMAHKWAILALKYHDKYCLRQPNSLPGIASKMVNFVKTYNDIEDFVENTRKRLNK